MSHLIFLYAHIHIDSCIGQKYDDCGQKKMIYQCTVCHRTREIVDRGGINIG